MAALVARIKSEPAVVIGLVLSVAVLVAQQLLASGIVTSASGVNWLNFVVSISPLLAGILTRGQVTPVVDAPAPPAAGG